MIGDYIPPFIGYAHDPRMPETDDDDSTADVIEGVRQLLVMAEIAASKGDLANARKALAEAGRSIEELVGAE